MPLDRVRSKVCIYGRACCVDRFIRPSNSPWGAPAIFVALVMFWGCGVGVGFVSYW